MSPLLNIKHMALVVSGVLIGGRIIGDMLERDLIVRTISATNAKIFGVIADYLYGESLAKATIERLDIVHKLEVIENYVSELPKEKQEDKSALVALNGIHQICERIHEELANIKQKLEDHKQKYFYYMRSVDISTDLANVEQHVNNLDNRFRLFLAIRKNV